MLTRHEEGPGKEGKVPVTGCGVCYSNNHDNGYSGGYLRQGGVHEGREVQVVDRALDDATTGEENRRQI